MRQVHNSIKQMLSESGCTYVDNCNSFMYQSCDIDNGLFLVGGLAPWRSYQPQTPLLSVGAGNTIPPHQFRQGNDGPRTSGAHQSCGRLHDVTSMTAPNSAGTKPGWTGRPTRGTKRDTVVSAGNIITTAWTVSTGNLSYVTNVTIWAIKLNIVTQVLLRHRPRRLLRPGNVS